MKYIRYENRLWKYTAFCLEEDMHCTFNLSRNAIKILLSFYNIVLRWCKTHSDYSDKKLQKRKRKSIE